MGHDALPGLSPAHRRSQNPSSPFSAVMPRKQMTRDEPDLGWRTLVRRHKFLLFILGILTLLCTVYLYFAVTLGTGEKCAGLRGTQRALCVAASKPGGVGGLHGKHRGIARRLILEEEVGFSEANGGEQVLEKPSTITASLDNSKDPTSSSAHELHVSLTEDIELWRKRIATYRELLKLKLNSVRKVKLPSPVHIPKLR